MVECERKAVECGWVGGGGEVLQGGRRVRRRRELQNDSLPILQNRLHQCKKKKSEKHEKFNTRNSGAHMLVKNKKAGKKECQ